MTRCMVDDPSYVNMFFFVELDFCFFVLIIMFGFVRKQSSCFLHFCSSTSIKYSSDKFSSTSFSYLSFNMKSL